MQVLRQKTLLPRIVSLVGSATNRAAGVEYRKNLTAKSLSRHHHKTRMRDYKFWDNHRIQICIYKYKESPGIDLMSALQKWYKLANYSIYNHILLYSTYYIFNDCIHRDIYSMINQCHKIYKIRFMHMAKNTRLRWVHHVRHSRNEINMQGACLNKHAHPPVEFVEKLYANNLLAPTGRRATHRWKQPS